MALVPFAADLANSAVAFQPRFQLLRIRANQERRMQVRFRLIEAHRLAFPQLARRHESEEVQLSIRQIAGRDGPGEDS